MATGGLFPVVRVGPSDTRTTGLTKPHRDLPSATLLPVCPCRSVPSPTWHEGFLGTLTLPRRRRRCRRHRPARSALPVPSLPRTPPDPVQAGKPLPSRSSVSRISEARPGTAAEAAPAGLLQVDGKIGDVERFIDRLHGGKLRLYTPDVLSDPIEYENMIREQVSEKFLLRNRAPTMAELD
jgi:hypothetical protein